MNGPAWPDVSHLMLFKRRHRQEVIVAICLVALTQAIGQLPTARMTAIFPMGCRVGTEAEVQVHGSDLDGALGLHFTHPGITAEVINAGKPRFKVRVAADVPVGVYEARFAGALGLSNSRLFAVGSLSEATSPANNTSRETAFPLGENTVVNGIAVSRQSVWFKIAARKGQRLLLRASAAALDSRLNPIVLLRDSAGERLARANDDSLIDYTAVVDGEFMLQIHDASYGGGTEYFFRLENSSGPHIDFVSPPVVSSFTDSQVMLYGRDLPGSKPSGLKAIDGVLLEQLTIKISELIRGDRPGGVLLPPATAVMDGGVFRLSKGAIESNPFFVGRCEGGSLTMEEGVNDTEDRAQTIPLPALVAGRFFPARDVDCYRFPISKDEVYWLDVFSQRLGNKTNPYVTAQLIAVAKNGNELPATTKEFYEITDNPGGRAFKIANRDVSWRFQAKSDGYCLVTARDLFNQAADDPGRGYVAALRRERPGFRLLTHPRTVASALGNGKTIELMVTHFRKGTTLPVQMIALREGNFNGPIRFSAEGLPEGVKLHPCEIRAGQKSATAYLTAIDPPASFNGNIRFVGKATIDGKEVSRVAQQATTLHRVGDYDKEPVFSRLANGSALSLNVDDNEPIQVRAVGNSPFSGSANGKMKIPLKFSRTGEYNEKVNFKVHGISQLQKLPVLAVNKDQAETSLEIDLAKFKVPVGRHTFRLTATIKGKYQFPPLNGKKTDKKKDVTFQSISPPIVMEVKTAPKPVGR
ncbi:MAG: hypothetical protein QF600_07625 [Verrucomicrobiota bacterium]|nr:hypothetical protein [Verrucomicrobiota bacterium]